LAFLLLVDFINPIDYQSDLVYLTSEKHFCSMILEQIGCFFVRA